MEAIQGKQKASAPKGNNASEQPFNIGEYFKGVRSEWHKITWPSRPQIVAETGIVLVVVTIFTLFVFVIDKIFQFIIQLVT